MSILCFNGAIEEIESGSETLGFKILKQLADEGYEQAELHVGCAYLLGALHHRNGIFKVRKNMKLAVKYLQQCAEKGNRDALHNLKEMEKNGDLTDYVVTGTPK